MNKAIAFISVAAILEFGGLAAWSPEQMPWWLRLEMLTVAVLAAFFLGAYIRHHKRA